MAKTLVSIWMRALPKMLDLNCCFSSEKPYHCHSDSLSWTGPQWVGPLAAACRCCDSAVKQRGREKKGPRDIAPKSFSQKGPEWCSALSIGVIGTSALEIGHFLRQTFWMISGGPFLSRPLWFTAEWFKRNASILRLSLHSRLEEAGIQNIAI